MHEISNDAFYDFIRPYDLDDEYYFVGEVDYHLLKSDESDKPGFAEVVKSEKWEVSRSKCDPSNCRT